MTDKNTMLACIYNELGKMQLAEVPKPKLQPGAAIVKVNAASICGTDFRSYMNGSSKIKPGTIVGHEACSTIIEISPEIKGFEVGDRIEVAPAIGCGECRYCRDGHSNMCDNLQTIGWEFPGVFAEYALIPEIAFRNNQVTKVDSRISDEEASLAEPIACVLNAQEFLQIRPGDYVAIFGSGFIGCMHSELALAAGAAKVIMLEVSEFRVNEAKRLLSGIEVVNTSHIDLKSTIAEMTNDRGVDVIVTACSVGKVHADAMEIAAKRCRISLFGGLPGDGKGFLDSNAIHYKELSVFGVHASTPEQNRKILKMITDHKIDVQKYITKVFSLSEIIQAFEGIKTGEILKAVIKP